MTNPLLLLTLLLVLLGVAIASPLAMRTAHRGGGGPHSPLQAFLTTVGGAKKHLAAAAIARFISIFGMYPVDTIKTRIQIDHPAPFSRTNLYSGLGGSLLGQIPYGALTFGSYEVYKKALMEKYPNVKPVYIYALASVMGDMTGSVWLCPSEVIKQQMQAGMFQNTREAFSSIWKSKGLGGLYTGYWGGVSRDVPFRIAQLCSYEVTKSLYLKVKARRRRTSFEDGSSSSDSITSQLPAELELSAAESALCGAIAGTFSSAITCPLDRIKTLLMTNGEAYGGSVISCAAKILRDEGIAGFTTGLVPRVAYIAPSVALFFVTYEACQQKLKNWS